MPQNRYKYFKPFLIGKKGGFLFKGSQMRLIESIGNLLHLMNILKLVTVQLMFSV